MGTKKVAKQKSQDDFLYKTPQKWGYFRFQFFNLYQPQIVML